MDLSSRIRKLADRHTLFSPVLCVLARAQFFLDDHTCSWKDTTPKRINSLFTPFENEHDDFFG